MSILNNSLLLGAPAAAAGGISRSLRFNSSDSAKCARTYSSGSSTTTQTFALWIKRAKLGATGCFWSGYDGSAAYGAYFQFDSGDTLTLIPGGASLNQLTTTQVFRDASAWYHIVLNIDTNNATSSDRIRLYVNGSRVTTFSTASYPTSGYACQFAMGNANNTIGTTWGSSAYSFFDGYLADIYFIDGQALTPSSFTETDVTTGQLVPKAYTGSYGTNGFHLEFADNSAATAAALGKDTSGNGNNWTPNNLSVTAGAGNDSLVDVPTSSGTDNGNGGEIRGNYCTWNPLSQSGSNTLSNGNLDVVIAASSTAVAVGTIGVSSGKWYWEVVATAMTTAGAMIGIADLNAAADSRGWASPSGWYYYANSGQKYNNNTGASYGATYAINDVIGVALDVDAGTVTFYKNGVTQGVAYSTGLSGKTLSPAVNNGTGGGTQTYTTNFGQRPFAYTAPSGFKALCTANLPAPVITKPNTVFDVKLITANNSTQVISGFLFSPDLVWTKSRSQALSHYLYDTVRGAQKYLISNATNAETTAASTLDSFNSDGFTLGANDAANYGSGTGLAWCWDAGSSTVTNTQGSISSQVRANATAGFSIVTYTGTGANATVGHGLGVAPSFIIVKSRTTPSTTGHWFCYHADLGNTKGIFLNLTNAAGTSSTYWNNTSPTSSVFSISTEPAINQSTITYVAYCFAPVVGYSSFGSYTANGSTDGPMIWLGFKPKVVLIKAYTSHPYGSWRIYDSARGAYNVIAPELYPNSASSEYGGGVYMDFLSNGFKIRENSFINDSGQSFIYCAWAESPFNYARAR